MITFTPDEMMCVCIARQVVNGEVLAQGINTPLVMAGYILAKLTHAPDVCFASAIGQGIAHDWSPLRVTRVESQWLDKALMHVGFATATADLLPKYQPKEFFRPAQVDAAGNFNNIALRRPAMRLPGAGGIPDVTTYSSHVYLYVPRHSRAVFTPQIDYVSGLGHVAGRERGHGPNYCVTDLGQFDWEAGRLRLLSYHAGVDVARIRRKIGFALEIAPDAGQTPPPSADELHLLREVIDPLGVRRLETLGGAQRKALLRQIIQQERDMDGGA